MIPPPLAVTGYYSHELPVFISYPDDIGDCFRACLRSWIKRIRKEALAAKELGTSLNVRSK